MRFMVDLHSHTVASDHAYSTIHDYIRQAVSTGIQMFACTDHGPTLDDSPHPWHFTNLRMVPHVVDNVAILRGIEANIMDNGDIDAENWVIDGLDIVLAGFHNIEPRDRDYNTELMKSVIRSGRVDIITHPGNNRYPINAEDFLLCAKEHSVAVEINSSSAVYARLDSHENCVEIIKLAKKIGNIISLGSDAHIAFLLGNFDQSVRVLEDAGMSYEQVLNTAPLKVLDFLNMRGHRTLDDLYRHFTR